MLVSPVRLWASAPFFSVAAFGRSLPSLLRTENTCTRDPVLVPSASTGKYRQRKRLYSRSSFGTFRSSDMPRQTPTPTREADPKPAIPRRQAPRRFWPHVMLFAATVLLVNGLFGERGLVDTIRARRAYASAARDLDQIKRDNEALRE